MCRFFFFFVLSVSCQWQQNIPHQFGTPGRRHRAGALASYIRFLPSCCAAPRPRDTGVWSQWDFFFFFSSSFPSHRQNMFPADGGKRQANCMAFLSWYCWKSIDIIVPLLLAGFKDLLSGESPACSPAVVGCIYHCRAWDRNLDFFFFLSHLEWLRSKPCLPVEIPAWRHVSQFVPSSLNTLEQASQTCRIISGPQREITEKMWHWGFLFF